MNKRFVVLAVFLESVFAILLVSFIGAAIESHDAAVLASAVYFTDENGNRYEDGAVVEYSLPAGECGLQLYWAVKDDETTDKAVLFSSSKPDLADVSPTGYVTFFITTDVQIVCKTADGSDRSVSLYLVPRP